MTDSEKLDLILKQVREIRSYISRQADCPQHLWDSERRSYEAARQCASLDGGYSSLQPVQQWVQSGQQSKGWG